MTPLQFASLIIRNFGPTQIAQAPEHCERKVLLLAETTNMGQLLTISGGFLNGCQHQQNTSAMYKKQTTHIALNREFYGDTQNSNHAYRLKWLTFWRYAKPNQPSKVPLVCRSKLC